LCQSVCCEILVAILYVTQWLYYSTIGLQVGRTGCVVGIEHIKELVDQSVKNVQKDNPDLLKEERIKLLSMLSIMHACLCIAVQ